MRTELKNSVRALRLARGLTQAELAEICGVSRKTINVLENQNYIPSTLLALKIALALDCMVEDIFFIHI